jgi:hypothetical protein
MLGPFTGRLGQGSLKCAHYWQSVLRVGLPFIILYRGVNYAVFWAVVGTGGWSYPWRAAVAVDIPLVFLVSTLWWVFMREIAAWKRKNQQG